LTAGEIHVGTLAPGGILLLGELFFIVPVLPVSLAGFCFPFKVKLL
jgi:hypothetical protein